MEDWSYHLHHYPQTDCLITHNQDITGHTNNNLEYYDDRERLYDFSAHVPSNSLLCYSMENTFCHKEYEDEVFFYHSDHLGSASWITNKNGTPVQYIMYAPYGEQLLNQHPYPYRERFTFTGKERDEETGYDYFGARNYLPAISIWGAVDPLTDKYIYNSPYVYCDGNPIKFLDPNGRFPLSSPFISYIAIAKTMEKSQGNSNMKMVGYSMLYPYNALRTGDAKFPPGSISNIACRFQVNLEKEAGFSNGIGRQSNAYRHTLWQAILTNTFGVDHAIRIGNAHEDNLPKDMSVRLFSDNNDADTMADLLNNIIGQGIAANNKGLSNKQYAELVLKEYKNNGLWVVIGNKKDGYTVQKSKLTQEQYDRALRVVETRGDNGLLE